MDEWDRKFPDIERSVSFILIAEKKRKRDKNWPGEMTSFKGTVEYEVREEKKDEPTSVFIDYDFEEKYGRRRRSVTVYRKKSEPLAKLVGTDHWSVTRNLAWKLQHNSSKSLVRDLRNLPEEYQGLEPVRFRRLVHGSGASACWSIKVPEEPEQLIALGLMRESQK